jgi:DEAD/DEAH box helicase domain-containing protein
MGRWPHGESSNLSRDVDLIPTIVAQELQTTLLDYLDTTFSFQDTSVGHALQSFLTESEKGIFKGPYLQLRLPFRRAEQTEAETLLDISPPFPPYVHQVLSFERLSTKGGHQPQPTLVTTGTGSGKTECFLYPLLDDCYRRAGEPGVKSIILYPMNALAADQARRLAKEIWNDPRLKGRITAGMYVGGKGEDKTMGPEHVITDRDVLRSHPPDILLTNYKMLDFLLLRPEDQQIWKQTGPDSVRYLVLDELHTYDGAQGSDVACLIRRLKAKLKVKSGSMCFVGTSATLAGDEATATAELIDFAGKLFGERFPRGSVIGEDRLAMGEYLGEEEYGEVPEYSEAMQAMPGDDVEQYVLRQCGVWFGQEDMDELAVGAALKKHGFLRTIIMNLEGQIVDWYTLEERVAQWDPVFEALGTEQRKGFLQSFLALVSFARREVGERVEPFIQCQAQLWVREMSRLVRQVSPEPSFFWRDDEPVGEGRKGLPPIYCRECGHAGWLGFMRQQDRRVTEVPQQLYAAYFERNRNVVYLFPGEVQGELFQDYLCPGCLALGQEEHCATCEKEGIPVQPSRALSVGKVPRDMQRCPSCETNYALSLVGSQASSLSSVAISHIYLSPFNQDKKLLAFTDSVQDASHRSGFFGARTYRFNMRTAIQTIIENEGNGQIRLSEYVDRLLEHWSAQLSAQELAAEFIPPDLRTLPEYRGFVQNGRRELTGKLRSALRRRLSWEVVMEYGFSARVGRTLDKVRCSTSRLDQERLVLAIEKMHESLTNQIGLLDGISLEAVRHFVVGLLTRTKIRGGVSHDMLRQYAEKSGNGYFLSKERNPYMSPFGPQSRLPRFLSLQKNEKVFDSAIATGNGVTWYVDWARRSLQKELTSVLANDVYRAALPILEEFKLLERIGKNNEHAYSIPQEALTVTTDTVQIRSEDGHYLTVATDDLSDWVGLPSLAYLGQGGYQQEQTTDQSFYRTIYRSGRIKRIFTHEHSSLLDRETREKVEETFKDGQQADAPNLLTCTPTLEMGIDVGDLSSTMVCSIPPTPTNYLQRIGRAGRATGNALILALANVRPHDLYFFDNPFEMIAGTVTPPGCYLDAPEMLKRQFLAFCMDSWCSDDPTAKRLPSRVMNLLAQNRRGEFPKTLLDYYDQHRDTLIERFLSLFEQVLADESVERLKSFAESDELPQSIISCLDRTQKRVDRLRDQRRLVRQRRDRVEAEPEKFDHAEDLLKEHNQEMRLLGSMISQIQEQYPLNLFTDEGILPNYAFPETGVRFNSLIYGIEEEDENGQVYQTTEAREYIRGAGPALRELAPFNTFYAESRKVVVDQVDTGGRLNSSIEEWRFCDVCSFMELASLHPLQKTCPHCGSATWQDIGQKRKILRLKEVSARSHHYRSQSGDETDEREQEVYLLRAFISANQESWGGGYADTEGAFGFEYLKQVTLREINFGRMSAFGQTFTIAGEEIPEDGFAICPDCGVVKPAHAEDDVVQHRYWCYYNQGTREAEWQATYLYRELQSEAIRLLLPVSTFKAENKLSTFKACIELGLRKKFKGNPRHLVIREQIDPGIGGDAVPRRFLILYDTVPGGTGYLKEFARNPDAMRQVLDAAFRTLKSCRCRRQQGVDGCYRCVYAYQRQRELEVISRELGIELLGDILGRWDKLKEVQTLSQIDVPDLMVESELEGRFYTTLGQYITGRKEIWKKILRNGKACYQFELNGRSWVLEPQVSLGASHGITKPSQPDFVLWPIKQEAEVRPVAVFMDGFAYHVLPQENKGRISDDIAKRMALIRSGGFVVWSLTWDDVDDFEEDPKIAAPGLLTYLRGAPGQLKKLLKQAGVDISEEFVAWGSFLALIRYLEKPEYSQWQKAIGAVSLVAMRPPPFRDPEDTDAVAQAIRHQHNIEEVALKDMESSQHIGRLYSAPYTTMLLHTTGQAANSLNTELFILLLRLEDMHTDRQQDGYKSAWRKLLQAANQLQFMPAFDWVSTEMIEEAEFIGSMEAAEAPVVDKVEAEGTEDLDEVIEYADLSCHAFLKAWSKEGKALPTIGFELADSQGCVCAEAEMAWSDQKVAVLVEGQENFDPVFVGQGWKVFHADQLEIVFEQIAESVNGVTV